MEFGEKSSKFILFSLPQKKIYTADGCQNKFSLQQRLNIKKYFLAIAKHQSTCHLTPDKLSTRNTAGLLQYIDVNEKEKKINNFSTRYFSSKYIHAIKTNLTDK